MTQSIDADKAQHDLKVAKLIDAFVVYGMNKKQSAIYAGLTYDQARRILASEEGIALVEEAREELAKKYNVSKERVVRGMVDAIERARIFGEPNTEINGWKELSKMHGYYEPVTRRIEISQDQAALQRQIESMSRDDLLALANGKDNSMLIEGEYVEVDDEERG